MNAPSHKDPLVRVRHMLDFARKAVQFTSGKNRSDLDSNEMLAMAVVHLIEMLGEACRNIPAGFQNRYPEVPWEQISSTRNRLAHGYLEVDMDIIWTIVTEDLPPLIVQLKQIIKSEKE